MAQPIFLYWHQGWDNAPELVQRCAESWVHHHQNSGWEVHLLHRGNIEGWLAEGDQEDVKALYRFETRLNRGEKVGGLAHFADLLRLALLDRHGGIWTDATTLCFQNVDDWLPNPLTLGMPRSLAQSRRTETWFIDNRCTGSGGNFPGRSVTATRRLPVFSCFRFSLLLVFIGHFRLAPL